MSQRADDLLRRAARAGHPTSGELARMRRAVDAKIALGLAEGSAGAGGAAATKAVDSKKSHFHR